MANAILAFPNYVDAGYYTPLLSGGSWLPEAPLSNLQNRFFAKKARSINCVPENTKGLIDLGATRDVQVVAIPKHNLSLTATVKFTFYNTILGVVASYTQEVYPIVYPYGAIPFEHVSFWNGRLTAEGALNYPMPVHLILQSPILCQYIGFEITDPDNPDLYVELSRLVVAPGWQPTINFAYGAGIGVRDETVVTGSLGGADFYDIRQKRRLVNFTYDFLPKDEAFSYALDMQIQLGLSGQLYFCYDPEDMPNMHRLSFLTTMETLNSLTAAALGLEGTSYSLKEVVS